MTTKDVVVAVRVFAGLVVVGCGMVLTGHTLYSDKHRHCRGWHGVQYVTRMIEDFHILARTAKRTHTKPRVYTESLKPIASFASSYRTSKKYDPSYKKESHTFYTS